MFKHFALAMSKGNATYVVIDGKPRWDAASTKRVLADVEDIKVLSQHFLHNFLWLMSRHSGGGA